MQMVKEVMEGLLDRVALSVKNRVPLTVSVAAGNDWGSAKDEK
jgi:DNA polymerase I-like protein with 3'-5' exonuclease and polymerase domains